MNILLLERKYFLPRYVKQALINDYKCSLLTCSSVAVMQQVIGQCSPDIFIMDMDVESAEDLALLEDLKSSNQNLYTLVVIRFSEYEQLDEALIIGADDFVAEPVEKRELLLRIRKALIYKGRTDLPAKSIVDMANLSVLRDWLSPKKTPQPKESLIREDEVCRVTQDSSDRQGVVSIDTPRRGRSKRSKKIALPFNLTGFFANFLSVILLAIVLLLAYVLVQGKLLGTVPSVAGYQMYMVISGSMQPAFDTGSLIFVKAAEPSDIAIGDIITFQGSGGAGYLTTHRVVDINQGEKLSFVTRGDANNVNDPKPVPAENLVGKVSLAIPYLGYILGFLQTRQGLILLVFIPGLLVIVLEVRNLMRYAKELGKEKKEGDKGVLSA